MLHEHAHIQMQNAMELDLSSLPWQTYVSYYITQYKKRQCSTLKHQVSAMSETRLSGCRAEHTRPRRQTHNIAGLSRHSTRHPRSKRKTARKRQQLKRL